MRPNSPARSLARLASWSFPASAKVHSTVPTRFFPSIYMVAWTPETMSDIRFIQSRVKGNSKVLLGPRQQLVLCKKLPGQVHIRQWICSGQEVRISVSTD